GVAVLVAGVAPDGRADAQQLAVALGPLQAGRAAQQLLVERAGADVEEAARAKARLREQSALRAAQDGPPARREVDRADRAAAAPGQRVGDAVAVERRAAERGGRG